MNFLPKIKEKELEILLKRWFEAANWRDSHFLSANSIAILLKRKLKEARRYRRPNQIKNGRELRSPIYYKLKGIPIPEKLDLNPLNKEEEKELFGILKEWLEAVDWERPRITERSLIASLIKAEMSNVGRWKRSTNNKGNRKAILEAAKRKRENENI